MELHGSLSRNMQLAIESARRLRGRQVHDDTLQFWQSLLSHARLEGRCAEAGPRFMIYVLIVKLETEIAERRARLAL